MEEVDFTQMCSSNNIRSGPALGVVAICKNEEKDLPAFIDNLLPWVDEIVIIDDGSVDSSRKIIQSFGAKVRLVESKMESETGFAGLRNIGIDNATSDWLLHADIDERIPPALAAEIKLNINDTSLNAFSYRRRNYFLHRPMKGGGWQDWNKPQLARRGKHRFQNKVHEVCVIDGGSELVGQLENVIWHLNDETYQERMEKSAVYCREQARRIQKRSIVLHWWHFFLFPVGEFFRKYIFKKGYRDGTHGLLFSMHSSCAMFKACALVWDEQNQIEREELEQALQAEWDNSEFLGSDRE